MDNAPKERYLVGAVQVALPKLWVTGNGCFYWGKGPDDCVAPDLVVVQCPPLKDPPRVWLSWSDPPVFFVGELGSPSNLPKDLKENYRRYEQDMKVPEYLFAYLTPKKRFKRLWIWRMQDGRYEKILPGRNGRVKSEQLNLWFGWDKNHFLRVYQEDGTMIPSHEESAEKAKEEERLRKEEIRQRRKAERQAQKEARLRQEESQRREEAERLLQERDRELAELKARWMQLHPENGIEVRTPRKK